MRDANSANYRQWEPDGQASEKVGLCRIVSDKNEGRKRETEAKACLGETPKQTRGRGCYLRYGIIQRKWLISRI